MASAGDRGQTLLLGIDEGTTAIKAALFDAELRPLAQARRAVGTAHPAPGFVEQDAEEVLDAVLDATAEVLAAAPREARVFAGLAHQGESVLAWDRADGAALTPIVVWQDKRQQALLASLDPDLVRRSGLPLDPYFSAGKLAWLLRNDDAPTRSTAACSRRARCWSGSRGSDSRRTCGRSWRRPPAFPTAPA
jgi:glycerol kinase